MFQPRRSVFAPLSVARTVSPFTPRPFAVGRGVVQCLRLVDDSGKLRLAKISDKNVIDTEKLDLFERAQYLKRLQSEKSEGLAKQLQKEIEKPSSSKGDELSDLSELFALDQILSTAEKAVQAKQEPDKKTLKKVRTQLQDALALVPSVFEFSEADFYRDLIAAYSKRLTALDESLTLYTEEATGLDLTLTAEDIRNYRQDIAQTAMWGGVAEAEEAASFMGVQADIYRLVPRNDGTRIYRRIMTIGNGNPTGYDLLHLGNHYVAIQGAQDDAEEGTAIRTIETRPDGNCLFEAIYIVATRKKLSPRKREYFLGLLRRTVARRMPDDAVRTTLLAILTQGDTGGLGDKTAKLVASRQQQARIQQTDEESLKKRASALDEELENSKDYDYNQKIEAFLDTRKESEDSEEMFKALLDLEDSLNKAEQALRRQRFLANVKSGSVHLGMDWWKAIAANTDRSSLQSSKLPQIAATVERYNTAVDEGEDIGILLELIDDLEASLKDVEAPEGPLDIVRKDRRDQVKAMVYAFETQELRMARSSLIRLYQVAEGSQYRVGVPLGRTDLHYDFYGEGEDIGQGQRSSVIPKSYSSKERHLVDSMAPKKDPLGINEGVTAVALQRAYPNLFSKITRAERREDMSIQHDVEYFDNQGRPWDQKAPRSHSAESDPVGDWYNSITKQLGKEFPQDGTGGKYKNKAIMHPVGVILDCTYMTYPDYVRLWSRLIRSKHSIKDRLIEINVPYTQEDRSVRKNKSKQTTNMTLLDACRTDKNVDQPDRFIYTLSVKALEDYIPGIGAHLQKIRSGNTATLEGYANHQHPVYRNHGSPLPDSGSYFLEFYANTTAQFSDGTDVRIVYDKTNDVFYITGTHYKFWMSPWESVTRNPFYRIDF